MLAAYETFDKASDGHFLQPQAKMGIARIYTLQGKKEGAKKLLENLKAQKTDNPTWEVAVANLEGVITPLRAACRTFALRSGRRCRQSDQAARARTGCKHRACADHPSRACGCPREISGSLFSRDAFRSLLATGASPPPRLWRLSSRTARCVLRAATTIRRISTRR
nr:putative integron gene cassette protein [uncultured bacterium]